MIAARIAAGVVLFAIIAWASVSIYAASRLADAMAADGAVRE